MSTEQTGEPSSSQVDDSSSERRLQEIRDLVIAYMAESMAMRDTDTDQEQNWILGHMQTFALDLLDSLSQQRDELQRQMQHKRDRRFENLADAINEAVGFLKSVEWDTDATADAACDIRMELEATFAALAESSKAQRDECQHAIARLTHKMQD